VDRSLENLYDMFIFEGVGKKWLQSWTTASIVAQSWHHF